MRREIDCARHVELRLQRLWRRRRLATVAGRDVERAAEPDAADHAPRAAQPGIAALEMMRDQSRVLRQSADPPESLPRANAPRWRPVQQTSRRKHETVCVYLSRSSPGGHSLRRAERAAIALIPARAKSALRTAKTSVCQSDVVIYKQGLPRIKRWPAIVLHEACCVVDAVGDGVQRFRAGRPRRHRLRHSLRRCGVHLLRREWHGRLDELPQHAGHGARVPGLRPLACHPAGLVRQVRSDRQVRPRASIPTTPASSSRWPAAWKA